VRRAFACIALAFAVGLAAGPGQTAEPVAPSFTSWSGTAVIKAKLPGESVAGEVDLDVHFGPNGGLGLAADEFLIVADDGEETLDVTGTYAVNEKGQPVLTLDTTALATELHALVVHVCEDVLVLGAECDILDVLDVVLDPTKLKTKVKTRSDDEDGAELALNAKLPFLLTNGGGSIKLTVSLKTSPPAQLVK
jgi:hypothetical protein